MAHVRHRTTKAGSLSTALVESYRDDRGRPRQRTLANLYGAPDTMMALAKLAAQRERLKEEAGTLAPEVAKAEEIYAAITQNTLAGAKYNAAERQEIDRLLRLRTLLLKRTRKIKADLDRIQKDGAIIKKHCTATDGEIQKAIRRYKKELKDAEAQVLGSEWFLKKAKSDLRQLSL